MVFRGDCDASVVTPTAGEVAVQIAINGGVGVTTLYWTISGVAGYKGIVAPSDAGLGFVASGIEPAPGYILTVTGSDLAGDPCYGTTMPFGVTPGDTTKVYLVITCAAPKDSGFDVFDE
jgi:hypothetical protein